MTEEGRRKGKERKEERLTWSFFPEKQEMSSKAEVRKEKLSREQRSKTINTPFD